MAKTRKPPETPSKQKEAAELTRFTSTTARLRILVTSPTSPKQDEIDSAKSSAECKTIWEAAEKGRVAELRRFLTKDEHMVDAFNKNGLTPLMVAAIHNQGRVITCLLSFDADVNLVGLTVKKTALYMAAEKGQVDAVNALVAQNRVETVPLYSRVELTRAASVALEFKHYDAVIQLMYSGADCSEILRMAVVGNDDQFIAEFKRKCEISVHNVICMQKKTAKTLLELAEDEDANFVKALLEAQSNQPETVYRDIRGDQRFDLSRRPYTHEDYERLGKLWRFKEDLFEYLRDLVDLQESTAALFECRDPEKPLGKIMWTQRGVRAADLTRGVLKKIEKELAEPKRQHVVHTYSSPIHSMAQHSHKSIEGTKKSPVKTLFRSGSTLPININTPNSERKPLQLGCARSI